MVVALRWLWTSALRIVSAADQARWIILSLALAATGVIGLVVALPAAVNIVLAAISVVLLVLQIRDHAARLRETEFVDRSGDDYADVRAQLGDTDRFEMVTSPHGHVVIDLAASRAIAAGAVTARMRDSAYLLPPELREAGVAFRRRRVAAGSTYNGRLVGLDTDLGRGPTLERLEWRLVRGRYWDHLASDILAMKDVLRRGRTVPELGRSLYVDRHGRLRDFGESWLLNGIGTSVIALTLDARLVVVSQSNRNESSRGLLAPSGSGSLEPADFRGESTLSVDLLAANGALREQMEEASIDPREVTATAFLGFGRWLEKSAKPELFTLALLSIDSHEVLRRRVPSPDRPYTLGVDVVRLDPTTEDWAPDDPGSMLEAADVHRLSVPVLAGLHLLATAVRDATSTAGNLARGALDRRG